MDYCNSHGITCVGSDDFLSATENYKDILNLYEKLSYQGRMNVRVNEQCQFNSPKEFAGFLDEGYTTDVGNDFFRIGPLKLITDGSRTTEYGEPYKYLKASAYMVRTDNNKDLIAVAEDVSKQFRSSMIGSVQRVLAEEAGETEQGRLWKGHCSNFCTVYFRDRSMTDPSRATSLENQWIDVKVEAVYEDGVMGNML